MFIELTEDNLQELVANNEKSCGAIWCFLVW